jgi:hypothetical protein
VTRLRAGPGATLAAGYEDGFAAVWSLADGRLLLSTRLQGACSTWSCETTALRRH